MLATTWEIQKCLHEAAAGKGFGVISREADGDILRSIHTFKMLSVVLDFYPDFDLECTCSSWVYRTYFMWKGKQVKVFLKG